jgi:hypothetical protein
MSIAEIVVHRGGKGCKNGKKRTFIRERIGKKRNRGIQNVTTITKKNISFLFQIVTKKVLRNIADRRSALGRMGGAENRK